MFGCKHHGNERKYFSHMSDHWNLLADLLGTPNYAPRSKKGTKSDSVSEPAAPVKEAQLSKPVEETPKAPAERKRAPSRKSAEKSAEKVADKFGENVQAFTQPIDQPAQEVEVVEQEHQEVAREPLTQELPVEQAPAKEVKERSMLQSSWDALASLFGVANDNTPVPQASPKQQSKDQASKSGKTEASVRPQKSKRPSGKSSGKSMWEASEQPEAEAPKREDSQPVEPQALESEAPWPSFAEPATLDSDRRGPRRSPRRGRGRNEQPAEVVSEQRDEQRDEPNGAQERPPRRERSERGESRRRQPESGRSRDEDRNSRRPRSDEGTRATRDADRQDDRDRPRDRPQRDDRRREKDPVSQGTKEPAARKRGGSGFAAGLSGDSDDREIGSIGFDDQPEYRDELDAAEPIIGFGSEERDQDSERPRRKKRRGRRRDGERTGEKPEGFDSDSEPFEDLEDADRSSESSDTRPKQGKVPSWAETIGVVVQANVANHQKQSSSGRGRHRRPSN